MPLPLSLPARMHSSPLRFHQTIRLLLIFGLASVLFAAFAHAQYRGSIQGVVTDPTGALIPGTTLTLTNNATNEKQASTSNGDGVYNFSALPPGTFTLVAERSGFETKTLNNVQIIPEQTNALNVQLAISSTQQTVTVNAAAIPLIDTENASVGATISSNEVQHMPSFGRDVFQLTQFAPGAISDMSQAAGGGTYTLPGVQSAAVGTTASGGIFATENGPQVLANGNQFENNGIQIDGISTESAVWGGATVITPSEQSVDDVRVTTNDYDAENGRFSGAETQVTTKSGTNQLHGSAFFQRWSAGMNAYQRYNGTGFYATCTEPAPGTPSIPTGTPIPCTPSQRGLLRDPQQFNQMGGSLGGPLWKNRIFAFFAYEGERSGVVQATSTGWYDTSDFDKLAPSGYISSGYLTFPGAGVVGTYVDQTCGDIGLGASNCVYIPGQGLNVGSPMTGVARGAQDPTWSSPTSPGVGGGLNSTTPDIAEYTATDPTTITDDQYNGRVDADITSKDRLTGTIYWVPTSKTDYNGPNRAMNLWHHNQVNDAFTGLWNHVFNPTLLNEARANAAGWRWNEVSTNPQAPFGLPQDNIGDIGSAGLEFFGAPGPSIFDQWTFGYRDIVTKVTGRHNIKFGAELTRLYYLNDNPSGARPSYGFFNLWDFLNDAPQSESGTFDPATGTPSLARQDDRENLWGAFAQDDYKLSPNLTLNLGLRYNYFGSIYAKQDDLFSARLGSGSAVLTGLSLQRGGNLWVPQKWNFGPEFGFAWSPRTDSGKLVFRGGFGINYNQNEMAITTQVYYNPGITISPNFVMSTPSSPNPGIVYATASSIHSLYGYPPNPNVTAVGASAFNTSGLPTTGNALVNILPTNMPTAYVEHYSLDMEYDVGWRNVFTLGYSGSQSRHSYFHYDEDAVASVNGIPLNPLVTSASFWNSNGHANYNSMIATLRHQMSRQFSAELEYNWARSMDTSSAPYSEQDYPYDPQLTYGPSDYNVPQELKIFGLWQPVFFHGSHSWAEKIAGGWSLSGIFNWHTGFPWTPVFYTGSAGTPSGSLYCSDCGYYQLYPGAYLGGAGRNTSNAAFKSGPNVGNGMNINFPLAATQTATAYFAPPTYTPGPAFPATGGTIPQSPGVGRNSMPGPHYRDFDATITKTFGMPKLSEGAGLEFRADAFNVFNNLNFNPGSINNNITTTNFGQASSALGARVLTLQASVNF
ncbi:MAG TPA: carboxypeptidase regulatory-like domain-containing protein [Terracidiphilus sp.]|nr:carboxypeptidase regulatory-like domain-containing protein [Terracidiphilus sp.]